MQQRHNSKHNFVILKSVFFTNILPGAVFQKQKQKLGLDFTTLDFVGIQVSTGAFVILFIVFGTNLDFCLKPKDLDRDDRKICQSSQQYDVIDDVMLQKKIYPVTK